MDKIKKKIELSICIVNWNTKNLLRKCLNSIFQKTQGIVFEIIVVDNASIDGSVEMLKKDFPQCKTIVSNRNLGFSRGNNLAIKYAKGEYIVFLNPDTELKTNALSGMMKFLEEYLEYGAIGCKILNTDGSIQFTCARRFPTPFSQFCFLSLIEKVFPKSIFFSSSEMRYWNHNSSRNINCLSGACIMTRKKIIHEIGGFNENYFMYGEDIELCYKIYKNSWLIYYLSSEEIYHFSGGSSTQKSDKSFSIIMQNDSNYKFMKDNYGTWKGIEFKALILLGTFIRLSIISLLSPVLLISNKIDKEISVNSIKKYFNLFLWTIKLKSTPLQLYKSESKANKLDTSNS